MAGRERAKKRALHRGLDDIINRDASLTSRLLNRVQPITSDPPPVTEEALVDSASPASSRPQNKDPLNETEGGREQNRATHAAEGNANTPAPRVATPGSVGSQTAKPREREKKLHTTVESSPTPHRATRSSALAGASEKTITVLPTHAASFTWEAFVGRWGIILRSGKREGKLRICEALYQNSHAIASETFFTSYEKLAKLTGLEKKQCAINIKQLEELGIVERLNVFNTATRQGTEFKLHFTPLAPGERRPPRYYCYDEDLR